MTDKTDTTILLDIYERLGAIEAKIEVTRDQQHEQQHEGRITNLERFQGRVGAYIWLGGSIASGVLFLLWEGIRFGIDKFYHH